MRRLLLFLLMLPLVSAGTLNSEPLPGFSLGSGTNQLLQLNELFTQPMAMPLPISDAVYGMAITGHLKFTSDIGYARVLLTTSDKDYLLWEASPLLYSDTLSFEGICEESCVLSGVLPTGIRVELQDAELELKSIDYSLGRPPNSPMAVNPESYQADLDKAQEAIKIKRMNEKLQADAAGWTAGSTSVSQLSYDKKKQIFGENANTQGIEYYKGGVFRFKPAEAHPIQDTLPESFSWKDYMGIDWLTPVKQQEEGDCWNFAATGLLEITINLYFNQQLNLDLSEQSVDCAHKIFCSIGGLALTGARHMVNLGATDEACLPYAGDCNSCDICPDWEQRLWKAKGFRTIETSNEAYKRAIITNGPISVSWNLHGWDYHSIIFYGYEDSPLNNELIWLVKNSWGKNWGEEGFGRLVIPISLLSKGYQFIEPYHSANTPEILCQDKDNDGLYYWGISEEKPENCPGPRDCDDSNPQKLGFLSNLKCATTTGEAVSGCCLSPFTQTCEYSELFTDCCPEDGLYADENQLGPKDFTDCRANWFYYYDSVAACAVMDTIDTPNAHYCEPGCCCSEYPDGRINASMSVEMNCLGEDEIWKGFDVVQACNVEQCAGILGYKVEDEQDIDDFDGDGKKNWEDNCIETYNPLQLDNDRDGVGDRCDNCPDLMSSSQLDMDEDGIGDACDPDKDGDGYIDNPQEEGQEINDNCMWKYNPDQLNSDDDYDGDACDNCKYVTNFGQVDTDRDGIGDACEGSPYGVKPFISWGMIIGTVLGLIGVIALGWMFWWLLPLGAALGAIIGYIAYIL